jgi:hypothetical protein
MPHEQPMDPYFPHVIFSPHLDGYSLPYSDALLAEYAD